MTSPPSPYISIISPRSRRLRVTGALLLIAVLAMAIYGFAVLMPMVNREVHRQRSQALTSETSLTLTPDRALASYQKKRARKLLYVKVAAAYAYWGVCGLLVLTALFVAWLDAREVTRNYIALRARALGKIDSETPGQEE